MSMDFSHQDVKILTRTVNYAGFLRLETRILQHAMFAGGMSPEIRREILVRGDAVGVLPYDPIRDEVLLIEQFRPGVCKAEHSPWMLEIVAGLVEDGESFEDVAIRESEEEAGCVVTSLEPIVGYYSSPGFTDEFLMLFYGQIDTSKAGGVFGLATEHEDIRASVYSAQTCFERLANGQIINASTVIALQWLQLNRQRLRREVGLDD